MKLLIQAFFAVGIFITPLSSLRVLQQWQRSFFQCYPLSERAPMHGVSSPPLA